MKFFDNPQFAIIKREIAKGNDELQLPVIHFLPIGNIVEIVGWDKEKSYYGFIKGQSRSGGIATQTVDIEDFLKDEKK